MNRFATLTPRERELAVMLQRGTPYRTIATELGVKVRTVETHAQNICRKLGVESRAALMAIRIAELEAELAEARRSS